MRFLTDENVPAPSVQLLRRAGHDVAAIGELAPGIADEAVLAFARENGRVLITFDRDFGELVYHRGAPVPPGIIYLRVRPTSVTSAGEAVERLLRPSSIIIPGHFIVVDDDKVRQRPLPPG